MSAAGPYMRRLLDQYKDEETMIFWCPGCESNHPVRVRGQSAHRPSWEFNGDAMRPTFRPSLLVRGATLSGGDCHLFVTDGKIEFCADSAHALAGKTVPMVRINADWEPI